MSIISLLAKSKERPLGKDDSGNSEGKKNQTIASVVPADTLELANPHRYRVRSLPATGALIRAEDEGEQPLTRCGESGVQR